jgi:hypothetical protein
VEKAHWKQGLRAITFYEREATLESLSSRNGAADWLAQWLRVFPGWRGHCHGDLGDPKNKVTSGTLLKAISGDRFPLQPLRSGG